MRVYVNTAPASPIASVEFQTVGGATHAFFRLSPGVDPATIEAQLTAAPLHQQLLSQTRVGNAAMIVTRSDAAPQTVLDTLAAQGTTLAPLAPPPKKFNPWAWRGYTSILGQSLQIASSVKGSGTAADRVAVGGFAVLNLTANFINIIFGGQEKNDPHQLRFLKQAFNAQLATHVGTSALPNVDGTALSQFAPETDHRSFGQKTHSFLQKYSVTFGEIFLRTLGAISLAFPVTRWKAGAQILRETGSFSRTLETVRNPNSVTFAAGLITLLGKFTSFTAKEPDPFNPNPPSLIDHFREKVAFRASSVIEAYGAARMGYDRFKTQKITLGGKVRPDYFGGYGNAVFVGGYGVRLFAPYGTLEVNMPELYAHIGSTLAHATPEQLPALLSESALHLQQHFANKPQTVGDYYRALAEELQKHHGISVGAPAAKSPSPEIAEPLTSVPTTTLDGARVHHQLLSAPQPNVPALA